MFPSMFSVILRLQSTTTHARTTGSGALNADRGEEPDVASPRKRKRTAGAADDSDQDGGLAGGQQHHGRRGRAKDATDGSRPDRDPLAAWFQRHFASLDKQSASPCRIQHEYSAEYPAMSLRVGCCKHSYVSREACAMELLC